MCIYISMIARVMKRLRLCRCTPLLFRKFFLEAGTAVYNRSDGKHFYGIGVSRAFETFCDSTRAEVKQRI